MSENVAVIAKKRVAIAEIIALLLAMGYTVAADAKAGEPVGSEGGGGGALPAVQDEAQEQPQEDDADMDLSQMMGASDGAGGLFL
jgi:hypothetical protein